MLLHIEIAEICPVEVGKGMGLQQFVLSKDHGSLSENARPSKTMAGLLIDNGFALLLSFTAFEKGCAWSLKGNAWLHVDPSKVQASWQNSQLLNIHVSSSIL